MLEMAKKIFIGKELIPCTIIETFLFVSLSMSDIESLKFRAA